MARYRLTTCVLTLLLVASAVPSYADFISTLALDRSSTISVGRGRVFGLPGGSTIRFHFESPNSDGTVPFWIAPQDFRLGASTTRDGVVGSYGLDRLTRGVVRPTRSGLRIELPATFSNEDAASTRATRLRFRVDLASESSTLESGLEPERRIGRPKRSQQEVSRRQVVLVTPRTRAGDRAQEARSISIRLSGTFDRLPEVLRR